MISNVSTSTYSVVLTLVPDSEYIIEVTARAVIDGYLVSGYRSRYGTVAILSKSRNGSSAASNGITCEYTLYLLVILLGDNSSCIQVYNIYATIHLI